MPLTLRRQIAPRNSILQQVFQECQVIAEQSGFDAHFLPVVASLVAAVTLITALITLLVWLRYLMMTGLITFCVVSGVRRKRSQSRGPRPDDGRRMINADEYQLEIEDVD